MLNSASVSCFSPTQASGMWGALCTLHLYPVSVSCIWVAIRTLYPVSRIRIPYLGLIPYPVSRIPSPYPVFGAHSVPCLMFPVSFVLFLGCALYFASCGLGRIPYPVSRIRIPYRGGLNMLSSYLCIQGGEEIVKQLQQLLGLLPMLVLSMVA